LIVLHYAYKFDIAITPRTKIDPGFYIGHFGGIVVHADVTIGRNCEISQGVTIGRQPRGPLQGVPTIGDNEYIGPGTKLFGAIRVGDNVAIGVNCVVNRDVPDNTVVAGVSGHVISDKGTIGILNSSDYHRFE
jgi:serine O-acetyltransferase